uniref:Serine-threonine/tyrosine-protein kinase catalytic domain-containing protein n=1 Tax=Salix viminalis TaxID=40686 RepID=A0A6N2KF92_SALVM
MSCSGLCPLNTQCMGRFSDKSDIFSFGVLLLEIVSGRRSDKIDGNEQGLSLLEFAWKLWNEGNALALVDPALTLDQHSKEFPKDRPVISTIISMLNSEIVDLPLPNNPAYTESKHKLEFDSHQEHLDKSYGDWQLTNCTSPNSHATLLMFRDKQGNTNNIMDKLV